MNFIPRKRDIRTEGMKHACRRPLRMSDESCRRRDGGPHVRPDHPVQMAAYLRTV
jgi:hypothetical protein